MDYTLVYGTVFGESGIPYQGAIVKFALNNPFTRDGRYFHNTEVRVTTNKYGKFEVELPPSVWDITGENFYNMTVIFNTVTLEKVIVPSVSRINFSDLTPYKYPYERTDYIGSRCASEVG